MKRFLTTALLGAAALGAQAQEITVQNDDLAPGGTLAVCPCFAANEEAAVWLTSPCDGNIVAIQIFWRSLLGGAPQTIEDAIFVYEGGTFPFPGPVKDELIGPVMTDGGLNEYRFKDENQTIPISIPVTAGEEFVVSLRFFNPNAGNISAGSVGSDGSGCQGGKNAIFAIPGGWTDACAVGVSGDWVIRAVVECSTDPVGAVCLPDGTCQEGLTQADADLLGGTFGGAGSTCADVSCTGSCFIPATGACILLDGPTCEAVDGVWQGLGSTECNACPADLAAPFGVLNFFDLGEFLTLFNAQDPSVDFAAPFGVWNFFDLGEFLTQFNEGCP